MPFRDVPGHRRVLELLSRSVGRDTLPPSLIFAGPKGSGRRATAIALAQALNCLSVRDGDACGECAQCTRIARRVHPDVVVVEPAEVGSSDKKIDQIRDVTEAAAYRPFEGRKRVIVIDDAVEFGVVAQNALLKTLEEPPSSSVFVLITERPDMLLVTVRSRCIRLRFTRQDQDVDTEALAVAQRVLARVASGNDASRLDGAKDLLTNTGGKPADDREQVTAHLKAMASLLRDIAVINARADTPLAHDDLRPAIEKLAAAFARDRSVRAFSAIDKAIAAIAGNTGVKVVADWVVLQL